MLSDKCTWPWDHWLLFDLGQAPIPRLAVIMVKRETAPIDNGRSLSKKNPVASAGVERMGCDNFLFVIYSRRYTRNSPQLFNSLTLTDADAIVRGKQTSHPVKKHFIPDLNCNRVISTTVARLRTRDFKGMKISPDGQRIYNTCPNCPDIQLSPNHIFNCPSILAKFHNIDLNPTHYQLLYSLKVVDIARAVLDAFVSLHGPDNNNRGIIVV
ncbi:hypothetical protein TNCV_4422251 [Trichonephila clavipes]|nr:hypothetical protein TNCV_4422251 [Trichonephila clavipes]